MLLKAWRLWLIIAILAGVGFIVFWHDTNAPAAPYEWRFTSRGEKDGIPQTQVTLVAKSKIEVIGTYEGSCAVQEAQAEGDYLPYEVSKVICWYAGGGHEVGVFEEPGQTVVRVGEVDEGASGVEGFRGNFMLVKTL